MKLTKFEKIYLRAMPKSCFNDRADDYKNGGVWQWSVTDEITEFTAEQARGVVSSLVKKGLIVIDDYEGQGQAKDMVVTMTEKGQAIEVDLIMQEILEKHNFFGAESPTLH